MDTQLTMNLWMKTYRDTGFKENENFNQTQLPHLISLQMATLEEMTKGLKNNLEKLSEIEKPKRTEQVRTMQMVDLHQMKIDFGKYKGHTFQEAAQDKSYVQWVASHVNPDTSCEGMKCFLIYLFRKTTSEVHQVEAGYKGEASNAMPALKKSEMKKRLPEEVNLPVEDSEVESEGWSEVMSKDKEIRQLQETQGALQTRLNNIEQILGQISAKLMNP